MLMGDCERDISAAEFNLTYNHFVFTQRTLVKLAFMKQMILDRKIFFKTKYTLTIL